MLLVIKELIALQTFGHLLFKVPAEVSHEKFWSHYFYRLQQFYIDEKRRDDLKKRADLATSMDQETIGTIGNIFQLFIHPISYCLYFQLIYCLLGHN